MTTPIDFRFDLSSPYGYLASQRIDALAAKYGRSVNGHPIPLGVAFKSTGMPPLTEIPLKGEYSKREPFWGLDRFEQNEKWLATGGS